MSVENLSAAASDFLNVGFLVKFDFCSLQFSRQSKLKKGTLNRCSHGKSRPSVQFTACVGAG